jgi:hypothetical protein
MSISHARRSLFNEDEAPTDGFVRTNWRGAVLYRDAYGWRRMPEVLWNALREADPDSTWWICGYGNIGEPEPPAVSITLDWDAFPALADNPAKDSPEWVAYNGEQTMAVLADFDVTVVGAQRSLADEIDRILARSSTSLRKLTYDDIGEEHEWGRLAAYIRSVVK